MKNVVWHSNSDEWETPKALYEELNGEFLFNLDPCATDDNHKCLMYYTKAEDGLKQSWGGCRVFCNPPYSQVKHWVRKAYEECRKDGTIVVMLLPARTDTKWFQDYCLHRSEVRFLKGRLKFGDAKHNAPFPSMLVIFRAAGM